MFMASNVGNEMMLSAIDLLLFQAQALLNEAEHDANGGAGLSQEISVFLVHHAHSTNFIVCAV